MTDPTKAIEVLRDKGAYIKGKDAPVPVIKMTESAGEGLAALIEHLMSEVERYQKWVNDLQAGMMVNCVYCGHSYGPAEDTPVSMADVLKEHIEHCPEHPMSKLKAENERIRQSSVTHEALQGVLNEMEHVKLELTELQADHERERAMRRHIARTHGKEIAKSADLQLALDAVRCDRDALNVELVQARRELKALLKIIDESMCDDEKCKICTHYQANNADADCVVMHYLDDGDTLDGECKFEWRGVCDENGGEDDV